MRLRIRHTISYGFAEPARNVTRVLRLTPRSFEGQHVVAWQIDLDTDCVLKSGEDAFGNLTHTFTAKGPCEALSVAVTGDIENFDAVGVVRGSAERMPVELFLRETPLTAADDRLRGFAREATTGAGSTLARMHALLGAVHGAVVFEAEAVGATTAAQAFAARRGNGHDIAHIFVACARHLGTPARVASGYYAMPAEGRGRLHGWAEVHVDGLGWTGFDAAHDVCPQESHVRLATGLDAVGAAPVRGVGAESVREEIVVSEPFRPGGQSQSQGPGWQRQSQGGGSQSQGGGGQRQG